MTAYEQFSYVYDRLMAHAPYDDWVTFTKQILKKKNKKVDHIVDLGCGTGEVALRLAKEGFRVTGVDLSEDMLVCAANKAIQQGLHVDWIHQDITKLTGFNQMDLFISYCDVVNYITNKDDLMALCQHVYEQLNQTGLFVFDVHHIEYAKQQLIGHTFTDVTEALTYIWDCEQGETEGEMHHYLTFFQQTDQTSAYVRFDEIHNQQVYDLATYEKILKNIGFGKIEFYADFSIEKPISFENSERIFIIAEK